MAKSWFNELVERAKLASAVLAAGRGAFVPLGEAIPLGRAHIRVRHSRPDNWIKDPVTGLLVPELRSYKLLSEDDNWNLITNVGRIFLHKQGYDSAGVLTNGLNYIALSNDAVTETATSTVLSTEIVANGLARAQGAVVIPTGAGNVTTVDKTFTCATAPQAAQKACVFNLNAAGVMQHVLGFTQRSLQIADTLQTTFSITLG